MYLYKRIRDTREDHDETQEQIATLLGIKQQQYSRYENGTNEIPVHFLRILSKHWKISIEYLVSEIEKKYN